MTREELNASIDEVLNDDIADFSLSPEAQGNIHKLVADYIDQEIANAGGGPAITKVVKVSLTSAEILSIFTTPKQILPAVAGKLLIPRYLFQKYTHVTTPYTNTGFWRIGFGSPTFGFTNMNPVITSADNSQGMQTLSQNYSASGISYVGLSLVLGASISNPTGGDGTMDLYLIYDEITID